MKEYGDKTELVVLIFFLDIIVAIWPQLFNAALY